MEMGVEKRWDSLKFLNNFPVASEFFVVGMCAANLSHWIKVGSPSRNNLLQHHYFACEDIETHKTYLLISYGFHNRLSQTSWLIAIEMYSLSSGG